MRHKQQQLQRAHALIDGLWQDYVTLNPHAKAIHDLFVSHGETVVNDHIAFRTFDMGRAGLPVISRIFNDLGWTHGGDYDIKEKKITAVHLNPPPLTKLPKVFISELRTAEFSPDFRNIVFELTRRVPHSRISAPDFLYGGAPWGRIPSIRYDRLAMESEYAAWVAAFGYRANHFTVLVNALQVLPRDLHAINELLKANGHRLNDSGGEVKGTPQQLLEQSSTMAGSVPFAFSDCVRRIPSCYYEFAKRHSATPGGFWYQGFIEASATRIFDSTSAVAAGASAPAVPQPRAERATAA